MTKSHLEKYISISLELLDKGQIDWHLSRSANINDHNFTIGDSITPVKCNCGAIRWKKSSLLNTLRQRGKITGACWQCWAKEESQKHAIRWRSYGTAKEFIHTLKLRTEAEWRKYIKQNKLPLDIPYAPAHVYRNKWINWSDWLGPTATTIPNKCETIIYIYELCDPKNHICYYIGLTSATLKLRLRWHISETKYQFKNGKTRPRTIWIMKLLEQDQIPEINLLETVKGLSAGREAEIKWKNLKESEGCALTNAIAAGGGGAIGRYSYFEWTKEREALLGTETDIYLAKQWDIPKSIVFNKRAHLNIQSFRDQNTLSAWGETKTLSDWGKDSRCVIDKTTISYRLKRGMNLETAMTKPSRNLSYKNKNISEIESK